MAVFDRGDAVVLWVGDSFAYSAENRMPHASMLRWNVAGSVVGLSTSLMYALPGDGSVVEYPEEFGFVKWSSPTKNLGDPFFRADSAASAWRVFGQDASWDHFGGTTGASVWMPTRSFRLGTAVDPATAGNSVELWRIRQRFSLLQEANPSGDFALLEPAADQTLRLRFAGLVPPQLNPCHLYLVDVGGYEDPGAPLGGGEIPTDTAIALASSSRVASLVPGGSAFGATTSHALTGQPADATPRRWRRFLFASNPSGAGVDGFSAVGGDPVIDRRNNSGDPAFALRFRQQDFMNPALSGRHIPSIGSITAMVADRQGGAVPRGLIWQGPLSMSSGSYFDLGTEQPADGLAEPGEKYFGAQNMRDYLVSTAVDDRPLTLFFHLAAEARSEADTLDFVLEMLRQSRDALMLPGTSERIPGWAPELNLVFVVPFAHRTANLSERGTHEVMGNTQAAVVAAIDTFHRESPDWARAGAINLYNRTGGNLFGASSRWGAATTDVARAWLDANGYALWPTDLLDGSDLHIGTAEAATLFAQLAESILRDAAAIVGCIADVTAEGTNPGDAGYGVADGQVTVSDLSYFVERWLASDASVADVTTDGANPGDTGYGVSDGQVSITDLSFFVEQWLAGCP